MGRKLTIGFVKEEFEKEGHILVSTVYIGSAVKLDYICPKGHSGSINWDHWKQGQRCSTCGGSKKYTIKFVKSEFEREGWTCLSTEYINNKTHLKYICSKGHYGTITWCDWKTGYRCSTCGGSKKLTIEFVKSEFEKKGWACLSTEYINSWSKLKYICPEGHAGTMLWNSWQQGKGCLTCAIIKNSGSTHSNWKGGISCEPYCQDWTKEYKEYIKQRDNYKCLNPYCNSKSPNKLAVHHINYNKKSCRPENLITVCIGCNARANTDRDWHQSWYKAILYRRYNIV